MTRVLGVCAGVLLAASALIQPVGAADVWRKLHRPLHLPELGSGAASPISQVDRRVNWKPINIFGGSGIGPGPVYPGLGSTGGHVNVLADPQYGGPWLGVKVFWYVRPSYLGPVLIRGRRLDGKSVMGFDGGRRPRRSCVSTASTRSPGRDSRRGAAESRHRSESSLRAATPCRSTAGGSAFSSSSPSSTDRGGRRGPSG